MTKDEEHVEYLRQQMQEGIDRMAKRLPLPQAAALEAAELGRTEPRRLYEPDLELIGSFQLQLPARAGPRPLPPLSQEVYERMTRHWVYRAKADRETVIALSYERRADLVRQGYVDILAFVQDVQDKS